MAIPVITPIITWFGKKTAWRLINWGLKIAARTFKDKYKPQIHALKSRKWEWDNIILPRIKKAKLTANIFDDPIMEYIYYHQACYIEDGKLSELIRSAIASAARGNETDMVIQKLNDALRFIEIPNQWK